MSAEPWQRAEVSGTTKASVIKEPGVVITMLRNAKCPIFVVGHEAAEIDLEGKKPIDYVIRTAKATKVPVVATAQTVGEFLKRDFKPAAFMSAMEIGGRLTDPGWSVAGEGTPHDLALILGIPYYMEWVIESGLKSFAPNLRTISLDRFYQPHCNWSFPNLSLENWRKNLESIAQEVEE
jgi:acetyl-CoA decarbonylase/synthase complex subunit epsilon